jgi:hypothetical protein
MRTISILATGALVVAGVLLGPSASRATSPCQTSVPVLMTGALVELRQGNEVVGADQAVLDAVPRFVCVQTQSGTAVTATDCWFPERRVTATLEAP